MADKTQTNQLPINRTFFGKKVQLLHLGKTKFGHSMLSDFLFGFG